MILPMSKQAKLYLALSCLQGRPMQTAAAELWSLDPCGLQLTPGNAPTPGFAAWLERQGIPALVHHGFCWQALRQSVWSPIGTCLVGSDSVHPPQSHEPAAEYWWQQVEANMDDQPLLETMYPGYLLGSGTELERAMDMGLRLAVDISHVHMQMHQGAISEAVWQRLQNYERIGEIHLSHNQGQHDSHQPLQNGSFGLDWARERGQSIPMVLECYMHRLDTEQRRQQMELCLAATAGMAGS